MAYNFKNLSEVERQDKPTENTTVMSFESGQPKQIPASEFGGKGLVVDLRGYTVSGGEVTINDMSYDPIYEAISSGKNVVFQVLLQGIDVFTLPVSAVMVPGNGFVAMAFLGDGGILSILFTNGSYHTTA